VDVLGPGRVHVDMWAAGPQDQGAEAASVRRRLWIPAPGWSAAASACRRVRDAFATAWRRVTAAAGDQVRARPCPHRADGRLAATWTGQVAMVTGGSRGIGAAVTLRLAAAGTPAAIGYHDDTSAAETTYTRSMTTYNRARVCRRKGHQVETTAAFDGDTRNDRGV
jgi:hypothetical protein